MATVGSDAYGYDANGNLTTGGGRTYTWNAENQPIQITSGTTTETYQYDGDNARVKKTSTTGGVSVTTRYVGALEIRSNGTTILTYDGVAFRTIAGSTTVRTYIHGDHLGSVSLTTNTNGMASPLQTFDPWGAVRSGSITSTEFNYTNQRKDAGTGLLFYNARYYDPALGRFLQADSMILTHECHPNAVSICIGMLQSIIRWVLQGIRCDRVFQRLLLWVLFYGPKGVVCMVLRPCGPLLQCVNESSSVVAGRKKIT